MAASALCFRSSIFVMDPLNQQSFKQQRRPSSKLHKQPPQMSSSSSWSIRKRTSNTSLQRHPSAPVYPRSFTGSSRDRSRTRSNGFGSSSSLEQHTPRRSPVLANNGFANPSDSNSHNTSRLSLTNRSSDELIGAPFDARGMLNALDATGAPDQSQSGQRPILHSSKTAPTPQATPQLRRSSSFTTNNTRMDNKSPSVQDNSTSTSKRYSDEGSGGRFVLSGRKKSGFSSFMNSMLGSPKNIKISAPENPIHVTHVGYDNATGQFTVCEPA